MKTSKWLYIATGAVVALALPILCGLAARLAVDYLGVDAFFLTIAVAVLAFIGGTIGLSAWEAREINKEHTARVRSLYRGVPVE